MPQVLAILLQKVENLERIISNPQPAEPSEAPMRAAEAAQYLGITLTALRQNDAPRHKKMNKIYFFKPELDEWIRTGARNKKQQRIFVPKK